MKGCTLRTVLYHDSTFVAAESFRNVFVYASKKSTYTIRKLFFVLKNDGATFGGKHQQAAQWLQIGSSNLFWDPWAA